MNFASHAVSTGTKTQVQFRDADQYVPDSPEESGSQWLSEENDEVKPIALREFRVPAGVVIRSIPEGVVRSLSPLRIAVEEYPSNEFIAHWIGPRQPIDTYIQYFGYGQDAYEAIKDLLSDLANNLASLLGTPQEKLHESAKLELELLLNYLRLENTDG